MGAESGLPQGALAQGCTPIFVWGTMESRVWVCVHKIAVLISDVVLELGVCVCVCVCVWVCVCSPDN